MSNVGKSKGFTLIELMIVVAIIAILASLAYYNYSRYVFRSHRVDGKNVLMNIASAEERFYTNFNAYTANITSAAPNGLGLASGNSERRYYTATVALTNVNQGFTLTATPQGSQATDKCLNLVIDNTGNKTWTGDETNGSCW